MKRVTVIGCGAWAMALASHLSKKGQEVTVWAHAAEEAERLKLEAKRKKAALSKEIDALEPQIKALEDSRSGITHDRLQLLALDKQINQLRRELMGKKENQFFEEMQLDLSLEKQLELLKNEVAIIRSIRESIVLVRA